MAAKPTYEELEQKVQALEREIAKLNQIEDGFPKSPEEASSSSEFFSRG